MVWKETDDFLTGQWVPNLETHIVLEHCGLKSLAQCCVSTMKLVLREVCSPLYPGLRGALGHLWDCPFPQKMCVVQSSTQKCRLGLTHLEQALRTILFRILFLGTNSLLFC